ncbi:hypothetical protein ABK040_016152 [Willaertia magna]
MKLFKKQRTKEMIKWLSLFSTLFFTITLYHINYLWKPEIEGELKDTFIHYLGNDYQLNQFFLNLNNLQLNMDENDKSLQNGLQNSLQKSLKIKLRTQLENLFSTLRTTIRVIQNSGTFLEEFGHLETLKNLFLLSTGFRLTDRLTGVYEQKMVNERENNISKLANEILVLFLKKFKLKLENNFCFLILNEEEEMKRIVLQKSLQNGLQKKSQKSQDKIVLQKFNFVESVVDHVQFNLQKNNAVDNTVYNKIDNKIDNNVVDKKFTINFTEMEKKESQEYYLQLFYLIYRNENLQKLLQQENYKLKYFYKINNLLKSNEREREFIGCLLFRECQFIFNENDLKEFKVLEKNLFEKYERMNRMEDCKFIKECFKM